MGENAAGTGAGNPNIVAWTRVAEDRYLIPTYVLSRHGRWWMVDLGSNLVSLHTSKDMDYTHLECSNAINEQ